MDDQKEPTRKGSPPVKVYCLPRERQELERQAEAVGLSMSSFLLNVGLGYQVTQILDNKRVEDLAKINGDLGRLGGLLKLWLTDDVRASQYGESMIRALLNRIETNQELIREVMREVVMPRAKR